MAKSKVNSSRESNFKKTVRSFYHKHGRSHLPWRKTNGPYRILVSEIMLQQTQADRVIPYYKKFIKNFPTVKKLSEGTLTEVLAEWQGLGYNRRGRMLHQAAKEIVTKHNSQFPRSYEELVALPGVGDYTAKAIQTFAFNMPVIMIETNIRSVFIYHFFKDKKSVTDKEILSYMIRMRIPKNWEPKEWYAALMDYGSHLKKTIPNPSRRSRHHTKQKPFKGSDREVRGAIIKTIVVCPSSIRELVRLPFERERIERAVKALIKERMLEKKGDLFCIPDSE